MNHANGKTCTIIVVLTLWQSLFICPLVEADSTTMECPSGRERTLEEWLIGAASYKLSALKQHADVKYAGDEVNRRPVPKRTIVDFSRRAQRYQQQSGAVIFFSFINDSMPTSYREAIPTRAKDFWCLVQPGDVVLLSDGRAPHFTIVSHIDAQSARIFFIDPWPDSIFLRGVEASIIEETPTAAFSTAPPLVQQQLQMRGVLDLLSQDQRDTDSMPDWYQTKAKLLSITRQELEQVIVGLSTSGSVNMLDYYLRLNQDLAKDFRSYRGFGLTTLQAGNQFSAQSAQSLGKARALAKAGGQRDEELFLASRQYLALVLAHHLRQGQGPGSDSGMLRQLGSLEKEYGGKTLIKDYSSKDLVRLGNAAGTAGDLNRAVGWLDVAIQTNSRDAAAYLYRSTAKLQMRSLDGTEEDASTAIALLDQEEETIRAKAANVDRRAMDERQNVGADLTDVLILKAMALQQRAVLALAKNNCVQATSDISQLSQTFKHRRKEPTERTKMVIAQVQARCSLK